ncbi:hypothetical protein ALP07_103464, partial [Pseudomonas savastanoi pv. glycinea]
MEMAPTCNHRVFRPGLIASIRASKPGLFANEPAFIWFDLQSIVIKVISHDLWCLRARWFCLFRLERVAVM